MRSVRGSAFSGGGIGSLRPAGSDPRVGDGLV